MADRAHPMRLHRLSAEELAIAAQALAKLAVEVSAVDAATGAVLLDAADLALAELHARAFGGGAEARKLAERHRAGQLRRQRQDH